MPVVLVWIVDLVSGSDWLYMYIYSDPQAPWLFVLGGEANCTAILTAFR